MLCANCLVFAAEWYVDYEKAIEAIQKQQWQIALNFLNEAIAAKAEERANAKTYGLRFIDYFPYLYRGIAYFHLGNYDRAEVDLKKSESFGEVMKASKDKDAYKKLQEYLNLMKQRQQIVQEKKLIETTFNEALSFYNQKNYEKAKEKFNAVLKLDSNYAEAKRYIKEIEDEIANLATLNAEREKQERVNREFNAGAELFKQQKLDAAEQKFKNVLTLDRSHQGANQYLDLIKVEKEKLADTKKKAKQDVTLSARKESTTENRVDEMLKEGLSFFNKGELKKAEEEFLNVLRLDSENSEAKEHLATITQVEKKIRDGSVAFFEGNYDQSIEQLTDAARDFNSNVNIYAFLGCAYASKYLLLGEEDEELYKNAVEKFNKVKELDSNYQLDNRYISPRIIAIFNKMN